EGEAAGGAPAPPRVRPGDGVTALVGGDVWTISGPVVRRGTVLLRDGRIDRVGADLPVPEGARVIRTDGKRVLPGFVGVDAEPVGISGGSPRPGSLFRDALDPHSRGNELALGSGVTALYATSASQQGFLVTQTAVLRPALGEAPLMVLKEPAAVWVNYARGPSADRVGFEDQLRRGRKHLQDEEEARRSKKEPPRPPVGPEILAALRGEIPVRVPAAWRGEIRDALSLSREFGVRVVLEDCLEAWIVPEEIARAGATAIVTPRNRRRQEGREDAHGGSLETAAVLERAGARFCLQPVGGFTQPGGGFRLGGLSGRDLTDYPVEGAFAVRGGASEGAVLRAMTLGAAEALGVADRIGSIEPGKDADLIVLDGDPLHYRTVVDMALVGGKVLYERSKSSFFRDLPGR
ncbi:MAG: amidohydrolase family protein, partial [Planctomycetaceae bacterium]|nr:amidohydrolase family protein [Planctomycetaceae bacterium]